MDSNSGQTRSIWMAIEEELESAPLGENMHADVCIVGAGIAGMTTAYLLTRAGKAVIVLDDGHIGGGMTERTTAHLCTAIDDRYFKIEHLHGEKGAMLAAQSHTAAIDRIEAIVGEEGIACEFERLDGYLFVPPNDSQDVLEREVKAAHRAGLTDVEHVERAPIDGFDTGMCLRFPRQAQFHPMKYLAGLKRAIERNGGRIFTGTHAGKIEGGTNGRVETDSGFLVTADAIVIATNTPVNDIVTIHTKQSSYTTYVIGARIPRGSVARALYWDTEEPYHYVRVQSVSARDGDDYDLLIVGGEDHKSGQADDGDQRYANLEAWARERFPMIASTEMRWSGQVLEPVDGLAFIGRNPGDQQNVYIITGDSGMGMTHGTIGGILITELIVGRSCPWEPLYDPSRITLRASLQYARENINVAVEYFEGYLSGGDVDSPEDIAPGEGAIVRRGLSKVAVYRDEDGIVHERSAVCPHLGGIIGWNKSEKTWDCPCHGSRFDCYGRVITGPANSDLESVKED
ncbi:FAD-dependent oxidoreductase [Desulfomicrobium baculatum]|uniref:FAD dependent oxidoreductase n=1 Tax=Desulfomicrobium baculatum (strain DSM 4028 / VKM B-1378 / X) TaxID=525897 RepID=C7LRE2_DESBD|nr:FAD-dependent oxidoreductase [Desulfomicrobium baculatum]ACU89288.1 FAD dependent oxidoreductase [Desulfomicrobium baculatum DSM 4028]